MRWSRLTLGTVVVGVALAVSSAGVAVATPAAPTVGSTDLPGAQALSDAYGQALAAKGFAVTFKENIGPIAVVFAALRNGDIDAYADFQGTLLTALGGTPTRHRLETYRLLRQQLAGTGIVASNPAPAVGNPIFLMAKAVASKQALEVVNAVSAKLTTAAYKKMVLDMSKKKVAPADVARAFLQKAHLT